MTDINRRALSRDLFSLTWPMMFGVVSMLGFQLVDSAFIGQLGVVPLALQGFTMPPQLIIIGVQVGFGIAITAVISRVLGEGLEAQARSLAGLVILVSAVVITALCIILYGLRIPLLQFLGASSAAIEIAHSYWLWWLVGSFFSAMSYCLYSVFRANGNTKLPGMMMVLTSLINLVLDPIFIFYFDLGINGAAIATIISFVVGLMIVVPQIVKRQWISFNFSVLDIFARAKQVSQIMAPAMLGQALPPLSAMIVTKFVADYGDSAVAAWGLTVRYEFFLIVVVLAMSMSMPPMVGRFLGAGDIVRIKVLVSIALRFIVVFQLGLALITLAVAPWVAALLTADVSIQAILVPALRILSFSYGFLGVCILLVSTTNALARAVTALIISIARLFVFFLPAVWLGGFLFGLSGIFWGALVGNVLAGVSAFFIYQRALVSTELKQEREALA